MAVTVRIPAPLRPSVGGASSIECAPGTVRDLIDQLEAQHAGFRDRVMEDGALRRFVNVFVAGQDVRFDEGVDTEVTDGQEVTFCPLSPGADPPAAALVAGGSGMVGRVLIAGLVAGGTQVVALARSPRAIEAVRTAGARPIPTDLLGLHTWAAELSGIEVVYHLAQPRLGPPLRRLGVRRRARDAAAGTAALLGAMPRPVPVVVGSSALVYGDRTAAPAAEDAPLAPHGPGVPAAAAEAAAAGRDARFVRLPWIYGNEGLARDLIVGLRTRRYRIVGPGDNRWGLIGAEDAARALRTAATAPPGPYNAIEAAPTQREVIDALCAAPGLRRPDHAPPALAGIGLGGALSHALAASVWVSDDRLRSLGWSPRQTWRSELLALTEVDLPRAT